MEDPSLQGIEDPARRGRHEEQQEPRTDERDVAGPRPARDDDPSTLEQRAKTDFKLVTIFKPIPGSLPKLRFGVTYREDKPFVIESIKKMISKGVYPSKIY